MSSKSVRKVLFVGVVIAVFLLPLTTIGAAQTTSDAFVTIGNVSVTPENPEVGEETRITVEFRNSETASGSIDVTEVSVRGPGIFSEADDIGNLGPGTSVEIPFSATFAEPGLTKLTVYLRGWDSNRNLIVIQKPVYVDVGSDVGASVAFSSAVTTEVAAGETTPINVTVANSRSEAITGLELDLRTSGSVEDARRIKGSLESGSDYTFQYDVSFDTIGNQQLTGTLTYTTQNGARRTTIQSTDIAVVEPIVRVGLSSIDNTDQAERTTVELTNFGNTELSNIEITAEKNGNVVERKPVRDIDPNTSTSVLFESHTARSGSIEYTASYIAAGETHQTTHHAQSPISGEIRLTSVETSPSPSGVIIDGEAANIGGTDAESVLLRVINNANVTPIAPSGEYFVGEVEASEFATFELSAIVQSSPSLVPVEISYIVDEERVTNTQHVELTGPDTSRVQSGDQGAGNSGDEGGLPLTQLGIGLVLIIVVSSLAIYKWRKPLQ